MEVSCRRNLQFASTSRAARRDRIPNAVSVAPLLLLEQHEERRIAGG